MNGDHRNNHPSNIKFYCRAHHMIADGRMDILRLRMSGPNHPRRKGRKLYGVVQYKDRWRVRLKVNGIYRQAYFKSKKEAEELAVLWILEQNLG